VEAFLAELPFLQADFDAFRAAVVAEHSANRRARESLLEHADAKPGRRISVQFPRESLDISVDAKPGRRLAV